MDDNMRYKSEKTMDRKRRTNKKLHDNDMCTTLVAPTSKNDMVAILFVIIEIVTGEMFMFGFHILLTQQIRIQISL